MCSIRSVSQCVGLRSLRGRPAAPSVIAALGDPQDPAEGADAVVGLLRFNKAIDHPRGRRYSCRAKKAAVGSTGRSDTVGFSVSSESEVWTWLDWVVQGCPRRVRRSCRRGGRLGSPSATSPAPSRSLPAPFTGCSRPPVGSLRPSDAGQGGRSPRDERGEISRGLAAEESMRAIAARVGRAASTVSREVDRNGGRGSYRALRPMSGPRRELGVRKDPARQKRPAVRVGGKEAKGGLVAAADLRLAGKALS
jgi:hypothetical protein